MYYCFQMIYEKVLINTGAFSNIFLLGMLTGQGRWFRGVNLARAEEYAPPKLKPNMSELREKGEGLRNRKLINRYKPVY